MTAQLEPRKEPAIAPPTSQVGERVDVAPDGEVGRRIAVAGYRTYEDAQRTVDRLLDSGFREDQVAIVADGVSFTEVAIRRSGFIATIFSGFLRGALGGAVMAVLLARLDLVVPQDPPLALAAWAVLLGGAIGAVATFLARTFSGFWRILDPVGRLEARGFDVMVEASAASEAAAILRGQHLTPA